MLSTQNLRRCAGVFRTLSIDPAFPEGDVRFVSLPVSDAFRFRFFQHKRPTLPFPFAPLQVGLTVPVRDRIIWFYESHIDGNFPFRCLLRARLGVARSPCLRLGCEQNAE